jgi:endonuclease/exonuclease/phosphatase family metal-dependent hydrolase
LEHPYERYGIERETNGEFEQIFYDTNIVKWLDGGNFWISEDPDTPGTKGWDAACVRLVTWSKFRLLATRQEFFFFNTQLDHVGEKSRNEGSKLLWGRIQRITQTKDKPFFLLGDFNTYRHTSTYAYFTSEEKGPQLLEAWKEAKNKIGTVSYTYHGWAGIQNDGEKGAEVAANHIDWIFYRPEMKVLSCEVITESRDGRYPSDHYPIQAEFLFPSPQELLPPPL